MAKSHYLEADRLALVIAAIQILGVADQASATLNRWVAELEANEELTPEQLQVTPIKYGERKKWSSIFEQHPEFFKTFTLHGEQHVLLRLRYAQTFNPTNAKNGAGNGEAEEPGRNDTGEDDPPTAAPLTPEQIQMLIKTAIDLHTQAEAAERKPERLSPMVMAGIGAAVGSLVGGSAVVLLGWLQLTHVIRLFN